MNERGWTFCWTAPCEDLIIKTAIHKRHKIIMSIRTYSGYLLQLLRWMGSQCKQTILKFKWNQATSCGQYWHGCLHHVQTKRAKGKTPPCFRTINQLKTKYNKKGWKKECYCELNTTYLVQSFKFVPAVSESSYSVNVERVLSLADGGDPLLEPGDVNLLIGLLTVVCDKVRTCWNV